MYMYNGIIPAEAGNAGREFSTAHYILYSLPKSVGKQVVLCTNEGNYQGQLSKVGQDMVIIDHTGRERQIHISSINAIVSQG